MTRDARLERPAPRLASWPRAREEDEISGYRIPAGSFIILFQQGIRRHPEFWDKPEAFDAHCFPGQEPCRHRFAYLPFGAGPRICIGKSIALAQGPLIIAYLTKYFRIRRVDGRDAGKVILESRR